MWQRIGRAGRGEDASLAVVVCGADQLDQWVAAHPGETLALGPAQPEIEARKPAGQLLPAAELMAVRDELAGYVQRLRRDEEERLRLIAADRAAVEEQELAERAEEIRAASRRTRGTAVNPPRIVSGPGAWVLKWRG